ncbi:MAG: hypothetical protein Q4A44_05085 [Bacteroidales bacterium]|nr:hypothetical protein [Bacteroidales bacterium]
MNKYVLLLSVTFACLSTQAQRWQETFENAPRNLYYHSHNPTRIGHNLIRQHTVAQLAYQQQRGDFHSPSLGEQSQFSAYIGGLHHIGKFDLQGYMGYQNMTERAQRWNSTLWINPYNPFVLADSVAGDARTEAFELHTTATYTINTHWRLGAEAGLRTGNRSDQNDPRPRAVTAIIPIILGVEHVANKYLTLGIAGEVRLLNSVVEYYNVHGENNHTYFLMKGMGDYVRRSSGDEPGYKRDYTGHSYAASLQVGYKPRCWQNMAEVRVWTASEEATDGGTTYRFRGGDYREIGLSVQERMQWHARAETQHTLEFEANYTTANGIWYDQRREVDIARGGATIYHILNKSTLQRQKRLMASLSYRRDVYRNNQRAYFVGSEVGIKQIRYEQLLGTSSPTQHIQHLHLGLRGGKAFKYRGIILWGELGGSYYRPLKRVYAHGSTYSNNHDIGSTYTLPHYAHAASGRIIGYGVIDTHFALNQDLKLGVYLRAQSEQASSIPETIANKAQSYTTAHIGVYLHF